ncbi:hypothetical protein [Mesorhizobium sp. M0830]|uniref:hypothetical protein n=1 Tax=Mesorhizobium sp. M0830 TaxID=2957008 RepID=UPI003335C6C9
MADYWKHEVRIEAWLEPGPTSATRPASAARVIARPRNVAVRRATTNAASKHSASMPAKISTPWSRFWIGACCRTSHICWMTTRSVGGSRMLWSETALASHSGRVG